MKFVKQFENKKVLVLGLAKSGESAARLLDRLGAIVTVNDGKPFEENPAAQSLLEEGIKVVTGGHPLELLDEDFAVMVKNPGIPYTNPMVEKALEKGIPVLTEVELAYLISDAPIIGITGSNGKTTTTTMIGEVLTAAGQGGLLSGNIGFPASQVAQTATEKDVLVMELSSFQLMGIEAFRPEIAVITNLMPTHIDYHGSFENYVAAKAKLFSGLTAEPPVKKNKTAVINIDDPHADEILKATSCKVLTYGVEKDADLKGSNLQVGLKSSSFDVVGPFVSVSLHMHITGLFNVYNTLAAIGAAHAEGVDTDVIDKAVQTFYSVPGRFELVEAGQDFAIVVDYSHTPDSLEKALTTARAMKPNRIITVFGCGGDRDRTKRPIMGGIAAQYADIPIVTSDNPRSEDPEFIVSEVEGGVRAALKDGQRHEVIVDRRQAIYKAIEIAEPGDIVLIAGKGHETYQILKDGTIHFDDREVARDAVRELKER